MKKLSDSGNLYLEGEGSITKEDIVNLYRLQNRLLIEENIVATLLDCARIWANYSNDLAASWLFCPDKDESILLNIKSSDHFTNFNEYSE